MMFRISKRRIIPGDAIFQLHDTHGFSFEMSAILACERRLVIDWSEFVECARKAGWKMEGLINRIKDACRDAGYNQQLMESIQEETP